MVPGDPVSKDRPRVVRSPRGRSVAFTPQKTLDAEAHIAACYRMAAGPNPGPQKGRFGVVVTFYLRTRRRQDVDNLEKLLLDGLNGVVWVDDSQVDFVCKRALRGCKIPQTEVTVYELPDEDMELWELLDLGRYGHR